MPNLNIFCNHGSGIAFNIILAWKQMEQEKLKTKRENHQTGQNENKGALVKPCCLDYIIHINIYITQVATIPLSCHAEGRSWPRSISTTIVEALRSRRTLPQGDKLVFFLQGSNLGYICHSHFIFLLLFFFCLGTGSSFAVILIKLPNQSLSSYLSLIRKQGFAPG
jgi:hypothetical protein